MPRREPSDHETAPRDRRGIGREGLWRFRSRSRDHDRVRESGRTPIRELTVSRRLHEVLHRRSTHESAADRPRPPDVRPARGRRRPGGRRRRPSAPAGSPAAVAAGGRSPSPSAAGGSPGSTGSPGRRSTTLEALGFRPVRRRRDGEPRRRHGRGPARAAGRARRDRGRRRLPDPLPRWTPSSSARTASACRSTSTGTPTRPTGSSCSTGSSRTPRSPAGTRAAC